jgi:internalin A
MSDQAVLSRLESILGRKSKKVSEQSILISLNNTTVGYCTDAQDNITGLHIEAANYKDIYKELEKLSNLRSLFFIGNFSATLFSLSRFPNLSNLSLRKCSLKDINFLNQSSLLSRIDLSQNDITDISALKTLINLNNVRIQGNSIYDLDPLKELIQIEVLTLSNNRIKDLTPLKNLIKVHELHLNDNLIEDISALSGLENLELVHLSQNQVTNVEAIRNLEKLRYLYLDDNLVTDISSLQDLQEIDSLWLKNNKITDITALKDYKKLQQLDLRENPITKLDRWILDFNLNFRWNQYYETDPCITLFNNPIEAPPIEIIKGGLNAIKNWFEANKIKLNEIKILLVGDAKAGKTSLCRRLKYNKYNPDQNQTDGIIIEPFVFKNLKTFNNQLKLHNTTAYFWDFGGQEIMSSTHQFFMTKRSVYVIVLEARKDAETDKQVRRWLERVQTFGGNSPVIIVGNKIDLNPSFGIDTTSLEKDFPQIGGFINVSAETGENIDRLKAILESCIPKAELFETEIDERWIKIKSDLQQLTKEHSKLSHQQFIEICNKYRLTDAEGQSEAIHFLNDLGIVLHFDEIKLSEYYVLDPLWVTIGVYRIITSDTAARQKGEIDTNDLTRIINEEVRQSSRNNPNPHIKYSPNECLFLADIMAQFKLSYYFDDMKKILIPDLLDKETPKERSREFDEALEKLSLIYDYKYMPSVLMPRLIVELKADVTTAWRTGVIISSTGTLSANAMIVTTENKIRITVVGEYKQKRAYLSVIRYFIDRINENYNVDVSMHIPLPGHEQHSVKYDTLLKMERYGEKNYKDWDIDKEFEISNLLDGIETKEELHERLDHLSAYNRSSITKPETSLLHNQSLGLADKINNVPGQFVKIVILTALKEEYLAVRDYLTDIVEVDQDDTAYESGIFKFGGRKIADVTIRECGAKNSIASQEVERAVQYFKPTCILFVGIAGSRKPVDFSIGDVVFAEKIYSYEGGKSFRSSFKARPDLESASYSLLEIAKKERRKEDWKILIKDPIRRSANADLGVIASGEKLIEHYDSNVGKILAEHYDDTSAVEMEGFGFAKAASRQGRKTGNILMGVIRGISDILDINNGQGAPANLDKRPKNAKQIASENAAAFSYWLIYKISGS